MPVSSFGWILRIGLAACFSAHGWLALHAHPPWFVFFSVVGLGDDVARATLPWIGALDQLVAVLLIVWPTYALFAWALVWTLWTAALRPLAGLGIEQFLVRSINAGPALALLLAAPRVAWFARIAGPSPTRASTLSIAAALGLTAVGVLLGASLLPERSLVAVVERAGAVGLVLSLGVGVRAQLRARTQRGAADSAA